MYRDLLPLGSVVDVQGSDVSLMICGRVALKNDDDKIYDYIGMPYPEGIAGSDQLIFFMDDAIYNVDFIGCKNEEEQRFNEEVLGALDDAKQVYVKDGKIVVEE